MIETGPLEGVSIRDIKRALPFVGAILILYGFVRRTPLSFLGALAGSGLIYRALGELRSPPARWQVAEKGTPTLRSIVYPRGIDVTESVTINRTPEELYRFWRDLENLPSVMSQLESVTVYDTVHSHWVARAVGGMRVEWDAEIINEVENELIGWRSVQGADINNAGSVHFEPAPGGRGTIVRVHLRYDPPGGNMGAVFAKLSGNDPATTLERDLRQFKQLMETDHVGENMTSVGMGDGTETGM
jgi:uncharacterized membrane protein